MPQSVHVCLQNSERSGTLAEYVKENWADHSMPKLVFQQRVKKSAVDVDCTHDEKKLGNETFPKERWRSEL